MRKAVPPRRGRPTKGKERLSREAILAAALHVIDAEGVSGVSMRAVASRLRVDAKSLYNHVDSKDALLDAVAEHILSRVELPLPTESPERDLRGIAHAFRRATLEHPLAATLVLTRQLASLTGLAPVAAILAVLARAGYAPEASVHVLRALLATVVGTLLREAHAGPTFGATDAEGIAKRRAALEASGLPALALAAPALARCDHEAEFDFAVSFMVRAVMDAARVPC